MPNEKVSQKLINAGIDQERYRELVHFSKQYRKKLDRVNEFYGVHATVITGMPTSHNNSSTVEATAERILKLRQDTDLIERCVRAACTSSPGMYDCVLKSVTEGIPYERLSAPCTRRIFYIYRRRYFIILDKER